MTAPPAPARAATRGGERGPRGAGWGGGTRGGWGGAGRGSAVGAGAGRTSVGWLISNRSSRLAFQWRMMSASFRRSSSRPPADILAAALLRRAPRGSGLGGAGAGGARPDRAPTGPRARLPARSAASPPPRAPRSPQAPRLHALALPAPRRLRRPAASDPAGAAASSRLSPTAGRCAPCALRARTRPRPARRARPRPAHAHAPPSRPAHAHLGRSGRCCCARRLTPRPPPAPPQHRARRGVAGSHGRASGSSCGRASRPRGLSAPGCRRVPRAVPGRSPSAAGLPGGLLLPGRQPRARSEHSRPVSRPPTPPRVVFRAGFVNFRDARLFGCFLGIFFNFSLMDPRETWTAAPLVHALPGGVMYAP